MGKEGMEMFVEEPPPEEASPLLADALPPCGKGLLSPLPGPMAATAGREDGNNNLGEWEPDERADFTLATASASASSRLATLGEADTIPTAASASPPL
mmetsp:Transcript_106255/g.237147  ORF Transcript_106255/g.237147 Transcript_106255/m.237147 type:complete len:98 (-) Transcript_106255:537-830(-)